MNIFQTCISEDCQDDQQVADDNHDDDDDHDDDKCSGLSDRVSYVVLELGLALNFHFFIYLEIIKNALFIKSFSDQILTTPINL